MAETTLDTFTIKVSKLEKEAIIFAIRQAKNNAMQGESLWGGLMSYRADIKCFSDLLEKLESTV